MQQLKTNRQRISSGAAEATALGALGAEFEKHFRKRTTSRKRHARAFRSASVGKEP